MEEIKSQNNLFWNVIQSKDREIAELKMVLSEYKLRAVKAEKLLEERSDSKKTDATNRMGFSGEFVSWLESHKDYAPQIERLSKLMIENGFIGGDNSEQG